jgi:integrase/recombinase XerC
MVQILRAVRLGDGIGEHELARLPQRERHALHQALADTARMPCQLPIGFQFLVTDAMELIEPVLLYLSATCIQRAKIRAVGNTQQAYCADLYEWWSYLETLGTPWDVVTCDDVRRYRDRLLTSYSPLTKRPYARSTVRRRLSVIVDFYRWAHHEGLVEECIDTKEVQRVARPLETHLLAHIATAHAHGATSPLLPKPPPEDVVQVMTPTALRAVLHVLGPLPPAPAATRQDERPVRDRLIAMTSVTTGMRLGEVLGLTTYQLLDLRPPEDPYAMVRLRIITTKGLRPRHVYLPGYLLDALLWYMDHERQAILDRVTHASKGAKRETSTTLFLNGLDANRRDLGNPVKAYTFERAFRRAVFHLGLTHQVPHQAPVTGERTLVRVPTYTPHDLRHTYAVQTYLTRRNLGDAEPWKTLQVLLGHKQLSTTVNTYLRAVRVSEQEVGDALLDFFRELRHG